MKDIKVYNLIFPFWLILFFPPIIFATMLGNFLIDSLVVIASFYVFKLSKLNYFLKPVYMRSILKVWLFGFLADMIGAFILILVVTIGGGLGLPYELTSSISYDPFKQPLAVVFILFAMIVSSFFIFVFNYKYTFKTIIEDKKLRIKVALTLAVVTIPWTFLIPMSWFY
ncbi:hypothetical protein ACIQXF_03010 [Lysinibacillus sp. NPDC097231]|uniref:hypothetical protein n=1 Tax=Lysinibacillus sp. NPDC097231 TaxID=3364142 RepID=UPI00380737F5